MKRKLFWRIRNIDNIACEITNKICSSSAGFLIIPKKTEQNQTKIFDRDKLTAKPNAVEFINKNSISDSSKVLSDFKKVDSDNKTKTMSEESHNDTVSKTIFKTENLTTIIAQVGSTVQIPCSVQNIGEGTVSIDIYSFTKLSIFLKDSFFVCCCHNHFLRQTILFNYPLMLELLILFSFLLALLATFSQHFFALYFTRLVMENYFLIVFVLELLLVLIDCWAEKLF